MANTETTPAGQLFTRKSFADISTTGAEAELTAQFFSLKSQLLARGKLNNYLARSKLMHLSVKVYAAGGENTMHTHPYEDHAFIVLQGQATFHVETDDNVNVVNKNEGVMLPRGARYWFLSSAAENLVMIRVGAADKWPDKTPEGGRQDRTHPDGRPWVGLTPEEKKAQQVILPGQFFGG